VRQRTDNRSAPDSNLSGSSRRERGRDWRRAIRGWWNHDEPRYSCKALAARTRWRARGSRRSTGCRNSAWSPTNADTSRCWTGRGW